MSLDHELRERAQALGFARMGVARAQKLELEGERLRRWLSEGFHGGMSYMQRTSEVRIDPSHPGMLQGVRSIVVFAVPYARPSQELGGLLPYIARYARGRDYHNVLHRRLRKLSAWLRERGHRVRAAVDSMPVFERAWAVRAGLGFIGKNSCLIVPGIGSHVLLCALLTDAELESDGPMAERCGECTLCLQACPTQAFVAPRRLDARRCVSYLTIEHRGSIEESLRGQMGPWLFGCDGCQDVCPFNRVRPPAPEATEPFAPRASLAQVEPEQLLELGEAPLAELTQGSPLRRPKREGLARNAALLLGDLGARKALPVLQQATAKDPSTVVREAAQWSLQKLC